MTEGHVRRPPDLAVRSRRVVTPRGLEAAWILVADGTIQDLVSWDNPAPGVSRLLDAGDAVVMPGVVDTHVHLNEPGRTEWEGFEAGSRAAAAGGITTLVDMPLNCSPVTTSVAALEKKKASARGKTSVDYGFWGGIVPGSHDHIRPLHEAGVLGFKCFLVDSGLAEFGPLGAAELAVAMATIAELGSVLLVHAELRGPIEAAAARRTDAGTDPTVFDYLEYMSSRPPEAESAAVRLLIDLSEQTGCRVHVVHVSAAQSIELLRSAVDRGLAITAETCPHYLTFAADEIPDGATQFKCAPPIREATHREALWQALRDGELDLITSDHSPCPPELKHQETGDFAAAWGGIASLQFSLPAVWTEARLRGYDVLDVARWMCGGPARLAGLGRSKGRLAPGYDADLVVWEPEAEFSVEASTILHTHAVCPYVGRKLRGPVRHTFVRGRLVFDNGEFPGVPAGQALPRGAE